MPSLLSKFVHHYSSHSGKWKFRRLIDASWSGIARANEVAAIRAYLMDKGVGVDLLNQTVATKLSGPDFQVKFAGVFCHKKPIIQRSAASKAIHPGDTPGCELGDLLTLFLLFDSSNQLHYLSGSLFQAKLHQKLTSKSQQHLYDDDQDFVLPANMGGHTRLMPKYSEGRSRVLRYLILNPYLPNTFVSCRHTPWTADYQPRWSTYLDALLGATEGLAVTVNPASPIREWDQIVQDLLAMARNIPAKKPARGTNTAVQIATSHFNNFLSYEVSGIEDDNNAGIPILLAIVQAQTEQDSSDAI